MNVNNSILPLRVATFNTYLISRRFNLNRETNPEGRAEKINERLLLPSSSPSSSAGSAPMMIDLLFLQEVWGVGLSKLTRQPTDGLPSNYFYDVPPDRQSLLSSPSSSSSSSSSSSLFWTFVGQYLPSQILEVIDTTYLHYKATGGLYDFVLKQRKVSDQSSSEGDDRSNDMDLATTSSSLDGRQNIECLYRAKHTFTVSRSKSRKGVEATLWTIPHWSHGSDRHHHHQQHPHHHHYLLVFNTHLDPKPSFAENRSRQIQEILHFVRTTLRNIDKLKTTATTDDGSTSSTVDEERRRRFHDHDHDWSRTGVLVVGDFNIKAGSQEYHDVLSTTQNQEQPSKSRVGDTTNKLTSISNYRWTVRDLFWEDGERPDDEKYRSQNSYAERNSLALCPDDYGRLDYIFAVDEFECNATDEEESALSVQNGELNQRRNDDDTDNMGCNNNDHLPQCHRYNFMPLKVVSKHVRDREEPHGEELSDHYALIVDLIPAFNHKQASLS